MSSRTAVWISSGSPKGTQYDELKIIAKCICGPRYLLEGADEITDGEAKWHGGFVAAVGEKALGVEAVVDMGWRTTSSVVPDRHNYVTVPTHSTAREQYANR